MLPSIYMMIYCCNLDFLCQFLLANDVAGLGEAIRHHSFPPYLHHAGFPSGDVDPRKHYRSVVDCSVFRRSLHLLSCGEPMGSKGPGYLWESKNPRPRLTDSMGSHGLCDSRQSPASDQTTAASEGAKSRTLCAVLDGRLVSVPKNSIVRWNAKI